MARRIGSTSARNRRVTIDGHRLELTKQDKVLYPETGTTKADVQEYYAAVAPVLVPQAAWRPATRKRWPDGVGGGSDPDRSFFRKNLEDSAPDWVPRMEQQHEDHANVYPLVNNPAVLAWLGQVAALEIHVPQWRFDADGEPQNPDRLVFDLDPGEGSGLAECAQVARLCRKALGERGIEAYPVTSGSKGIHVYAALDGASTSEQASDLAHELARSLEADHPDLVVSDMKKSARRGKVFVDWSQNSRSKTTVCPYSLRGRSRPNVAAPRTWDEIDDPGLRQLDHREVMERVADGQDPLAALALDPGLLATGVRTGSTGSGTGSENDDALSTYRSKRKAGRTPEPVPARRVGRGQKEPVFVIQKHDASSLHYDTRVERDGVLVSWAVPKGPPLRRGVNRLAVQTEDHPLEYATFEGTIPEDQYGGGTVEIWDTGTAEVEKWRDGEEVIVVFHGRLDGGLGGVPRRYVFIHTGDDWLMQLMKDQPEGTNRSGSEGRDGSAAEGRRSPRSSVSGTGGGEESRQEAVIIGWREGRGRRARTFGSLLIAVSSGDRLGYAGRVGSGFSEAELDDLHARLQRLERKTPPVADVPAADQERAHWTTPKLVCEVTESDTSGVDAAKTPRLHRPVWKGLLSKRGRRGATLGA